ncbi:hypothetical protein FB451DRAFT_1261492 [Mycena latifolia]|nr:hypothetical protein FB451DRAFT_1261492 [Mycena latifolia]
MGDHVTSFFPNARDFSIYGGTFINGNQIQTMQHTEMSERLGLPIIRNESIYPVKQVLSRPGYRVHAGEMNGRAVAIKVFSGPRAQEARDESAADAQGLMHPNFIQLMGCSPDLSPEPFLVYHGGLEGSVEQMLATVLREELLRCLIMGVTIAHGISSGLCYLADKGYRLEDLDFERDFDLMMNPDGNLKMAVKKGAISPGGDVEMTDLGSSSQPALFDSLCGRAFMEANHLLYRDKVHRDAQLISSSFPAPTPVNGSERIDSEVQSIVEETPDKYVRRELVWKPSRKNKHLTEISRQAEHLLFRLRVLSSASSFVRHYNAVEEEIVFHRCPGYRREEILLTTDLATSMVVYHSAPSLEEICTVCGEVVYGRVASRASQIAAALRRRKVATFTCPHCPASFTAKHNLKNHINGHLGVRPYTCLCGEAFFSQTVLRRHQKACLSAQPAAN